MVAVAGALLVATAADAHARQPEDKQPPAQAGAPPKVDDAHEQEEKESEHGASSPARQEVEAQSAPPKPSEETVDVRPVKGLSTRLEARHDRASTDMFFRGEVEGDGSPGRPYVPNTTRQTTLLLGVTAWF